MAHRYTVPQFIDVEDKIIGPITGRQFVILLIAAVIGAILWKMPFNFVTFIVLLVLDLALAGVLAFMRVNGQPFHYFLLNLVQTFRRPGLRIWDKTLEEAELREFVKAAPPPPPRVRIRKAPLAHTRLTELTLVVNTGGTFNPED